MALTFQVDDIPDIPPLDWKSPFEEDVFAIRGGETYSQRLDRYALKHGFRGFMHWTSGDFYWGEWVRNKREGRGIHVYKNGNRYEGRWKNNKREGQGIFWVIDEGNKYKVRYRGSWKDNLFEGKGQLNGECGEKYEGRFKKGMRHGLGKQKYFAGIPGCYHEYHGEWKENKRHGIGTLKMANGDVYEGNFYEGVKEGPGVYYFAELKAKYEGVWKGDMLKCGSYVKPKKTVDNVLPMAEVARHTLLTQDIMNGVLQTTSF